jgi:ABC-type transport system involved in multi-copper enzyme maturation permease subunit
VIGTGRPESRLAFMNPALRKASDLLPTNPIVVRLVAGAGRRRRDLHVRGATLGALMLLVFFALLGSGGGTVRDMAQSGANAFTLISYGQVAAICLLTPLFMAGAIAQESNPRTWQILLTTPLSSLQIVLGNLVGRLFFALALLLATLPLCLAARLFGGVRGSGVAAAMAVSGCSAVFLGSLAVTLSVMRSTGKRGVFAFYAGTVLVLFATAAADLAMRAPIAPGSDATFTTWVTPLNPFLTLRSALDSNAYRPWSFAPDEAGLLARAWLGHPLASLVCGSLVASVLLLSIATLRVRLVGSRAEADTGSIGRFLRRVSRRGERAPRRVWQNPVAWREASLRLSTPLARASRWGLFLVGILVALVVLALHRVGAIDTVTTRLALGALVMAEVVLALLVAISASATAVSREREDGSLDILLTTPIQPGPYLLGKLRGLIVVLWPAIATPSITLILGALYTRLGGLGATGVTTNAIIGSQTVAVPLVLAPAAFAFPVAFTGFLSFAVMTGLQWSVGSRGVIGSALGALGVVAGALVTLGLCGAAAGSDIWGVGPAVSCLSPVNLALAAVAPELVMKASIVDPGSLGVAFLIGTVIAVTVEVIVTIAMLAAMRRSFMMTVRRLAGLK